MLYFCTLQDEPPFKDGQKLYVFLHEQTETAGKYKREARYVLQGTVLTAQEFSLIRVGEQKREGWMQPFQPFEGDETFHNGFIIDSLTAPY